MPERINPIERARDRSWAALAGTVSFLSTHVRPVGNLIVGANPQIERVTYKSYPRISAKYTQWEEYEPDPDVTSLPWPAQYRKAAVTKIDMARLKREHDRHHARTISYGRPHEVKPEPFRPAIAWTIGDVVMAAELEGYRQAQLTNVGRYAVRIPGGDEPLRTTAGLIVNNGRGFYGVPSAVEPLGVTTLEHLYEQAAAVTPRGDEARDADVQRKQELGIPDWLESGVTVPIY